MKTYAEMTREELTEEIARLRSDMQSQRNEIVSDIVKRIQSIPKQETPPAQSRPAQTVPSGPCMEYVVRPGDTLTLIAKAFDTTVPKIRELNNMKSDMVRAGQKILVPQEQPKKR